MRVYQGNKESVKGSNEITNSELLYAKARDCLMELSMLLGLDVMRRMPEEDVAQYAGPKGKHNTQERTVYRHGTENNTIVMGGKKVRLNARGAALWMAAASCRWKHAACFNQKIL